MPVAAPAMLEGYASTRPPRTAYRAQNTVHSGRAQAPH